MAQETDAIKTVRRGTRRRLNLLIQLKITPLKLNTAGQSQMAVSPSFSDAACGGWPVFRGVTLRFYKTEQGG